MPTKNDNEIKDILCRAGLSPVESSTNPGTFTVKGSHAFSAEQYSNRNNSGWKAAEHIVINDFISNSDDLLHKWRIFTSNDSTRPGLQKLYFLKDNINNDVFVQYDSQGELIAEGKLSDLIEKNPILSGHHVDNLTQNAPLILGEGEEEYHIDREDESICNQNNTKWVQKIYFGAPGTGKSYKVTDLIGEGDPSNSSRVYRTTFHPDYDYSNFVGSYKPSPGDVQKGESSITYKFQPQVFIDAYMAAWKAYCNHESEPIWLVIEEINRGNCAQIFGDIFQLLDRDEKGFSKYPIQCNKDLSIWLGQELKNRSIYCPYTDKLVLPPTLSILATMNTSDQSLFPMDSAFKRRWQWEYVPINTDEDPSKNEAANFEIELECSDKTHKYSWIKFIKEVNKHILELTLSEDKQLGTYFIDGSVKMDEFTGKVMFYLWNDICKDEYHANKLNFMRKTMSENAEPEEFTFNELYEGTPQNMADILNGFMKYLGVEEKE